MPRIPMKPWRRKDYTKQSLYSIVKDPSILYHRRHIDLKEIIFLGDNNIYGGDF